MGTGVVDHWAMACMGVGMVVVVIAVAVVTDVSHVAAVAFGVGTVVHSLMEKI